MSEPFLERLSRFTPDAGRLDRDALLFAAGRGSARPNRSWKALAALLASTQALSLCVLWPRSTPPEGRSTTAVAVGTFPMPPANLESRTTDAFASTGAWSTRHKLVDAESDDFLEDNVNLIDSGPPLKALGPPPPSLLN